MKPIHFLPPAIALAIAGGMLGAQQQKIARLENESAVLKKRIKADKNRFNLAVAAPMRPTKSEASGDETDWMEIAGFISAEEKGHSMGEIRMIISLRHRLQEMDKEQLVAALDKVQSLKLGDEERMTLEFMILDPLLRKDTELALNRFSSRLNDDESGMSWEFAKALGKWAKADQAAATAWLDKRIADGTFASNSLDGKNSVRLNFETNLIANLLATDPNAAEARIVALPADQRKDALDGYRFKQLTEDEQIAHATLVRSQLSEKEQIEVFCQQASTMAMHGSLEKVGSYLNRIGASGGERIKAAELAAQYSIISKAHQSKVSEEKIDKMRHWLGTQAPGAVGKVTGGTLGYIASRDESKDFPEVVGMLMKYHERDGGDDLLTSFLERTRNQGGKEELRKIANLIRDMKKREEALEKLK